MIKIHHIDLPESVKGAVMLNDDGTYLVFINAGLSEEDRAAAIRHELAHIRLGHLKDSSKSAAVCEAEVAALV